MLGTMASANWVDFDQHGVEFEPDFVDDRLHATEFVERPEILAGCPGSNSRDIWHHRRRCLAKKRTLRTPSQPWILKLCIGQVAWMCGGACPADGQDMPLRRPNQESSRLPGS